MADGGLNIRDKPGRYSAAGNNGIRAREPRVQWLGAFLARSGHRAGPDRDSGRLCAARCQVGSLFTCCPAFVCVCHEIAVPALIGDPTEIKSYSSQRANVIVVIMCHELIRPISAPRPAPRREQKADLRRLMSGTVCFLTFYIKTKKLRRTQRTLP